VDGVGQARPRYAVIVRHLSLSAAVAISVLGGAVLSLAIAWVPVLQSGTAEPPFVWTDPDPAYQPLALEEADTRFRLLGKTVGELTLGAVAFACPIFAVLLGVPAAVRAAHAERVRRGRSHF
jgi:hypothetical protein